MYNIKQAFPGYKDIVFPKSPYWILPKGLTDYLGGKVGKLFSLYPSLR